MQLYQKLFLASLVMTIVPMFALGYIYYTNFVGLIENEMRKSYEQMVNQYVESINFRVGIYKNLLNGVVQNTTIQELFAGHTTEDDVLATSRNVGREIRALLSGNPVRRDIDIMLYPALGNITPDGRYIFDVQQLKGYSWFEPAKAGVVIIEYIRGRQNRAVLTIVMPIYDLVGGNFQVIIGYARIDIHTDVLFNLGGTIFSEYGNGIIVHNSGGRQVFANIGTTESLIQFATDSFRPPHTQILNFNGGRSIVVNHPLEMINSGGTFVFSYNDVYKEIAENGIFILVVFIITVLASLCFSILFSLSFSRRITRLVDKMSKVGDGDFSLNDTTDDGDEIHVLDHNFNQMTQKLKKSINDLYVSQLERRTAELVALQSQINPHFLYNTLESIGSIASVNNIGIISDMCEQLGAIFRYNICTDNNELVALEEEINLIDNYISLQKIRFGDSINVFFNIQEDVKEYKVPRFILQPIVENVFHHGYNIRRGKCCIEVSTAVTSNILTIRVQDDGIGIPAKRLRELLEYMNNNSKQNLNDWHHKSIGLKNVNVRIKLAYGNEYGVSITSKVDMGTLVTVSLPLKGGHDDV